MPAYLLFAGVFAEGIHSNACLLEIFDLHLKDIWKPGIIQGNRFSFRKSSYKMKASENKENKDRKQERGLA